MTLENDINNKVSDYLIGKYQIESIDYVPNKVNVYAGKRIKKAELTVFSIDLRKSSELLFKKNQEISSKIHKAFITVIVDVLLRMGGKIRSFQGDSILAFFPAKTKNNITSVVKSAMYINWFLTKKLKSYFDEYTELDYGIGIDWGTVYILRAGVADEVSNNDLLYIGKCVNLAVAIANSYNNQSIGITTRTYENILQEAIIHEKNGSEINMWKDDSITWSNQTWNLKKSSYTWNLSL
jgi:class 3 adenylate cyclase